MRTTRLTRALFPVVASFLLTACASGGGGPAQQSAEESEEPTEEGARIENLLIEVVNDFTPSSQVTIYMMPYAGSGERLGEVPPNGRRVFYYTVERPSDQHRLRAVGTGGRDLLTNFFTLENATELQWTVTDVTVRVIR